MSDRTTDLHSSRCSLIIHRFVKCVAATLLVCAALEYSSTCSQAQSTGDSGGTLIINGGYNYGASATLIYGGTLNLTNGGSPGILTLSPVGTIGSPGSIGLVTLVGSNTLQLALTPTLSLTVGVSSSSPLRLYQTGSVWTFGGVVGQPMNYRITGTGLPTGFAATGLPVGLNVDHTTGVISGSPTVTGTFNVTLSAATPVGTNSANVTISVSPIPFLSGETSLGSSVYYAALPNGNYFGAYSYMSDPNFLYSYDLSSYEYLRDVNDSSGGIYLYDFASDTWFYTSRAFSYPYLYDFTRHAVVYYYQGTANPRYFYDFGSREIITK